MVVRADLLFEYALLSAHALNLVLEVLNVRKGLAHTNKAFSIENEYSAAPRA